MRQYSTTRFISAPARARARGQALVLGMVLLLVLCVGALLVFNTGQVVQKKVQLTNAADAAAYSVAVQQARAWNTAAYLNRGRVANEVAIAQMVSMYSWMNQVHTSTKVLEYMMSALSVIPGLNAFTIPLSRALNAAGGVLGQVRNGYKNAAQKAGLPLLGFLDRTYAAGAEAAIRYGSKAEALYIARAVVSANVPNARLSAIGYAVLMTQLQRAESTYLERHIVKGSRRGNNPHGAEIYRNVVMESRDRFTRDRNDRVMLGPIGFASYGGTDMVENGRTDDQYNRWAGLDTMQLKIKLPWPMDDIDVPIGWGGAQAVERYSNQAFWPGINGGRGWRSPYGNRQLFRPYGGMNSRDWVSRLAANDPHVSLAGGKKQGAYFTGYDGLENYHDVKRGTRIGSGPDEGPIFSVLAEVDMREARTSTVVGMGAERMRLEDGAKKIAALSSAQVYFNRPPDYALFRRADGKLETGSLFSPYWQARLVETPTKIRLSLGITGAAGG